MIKLLSLLFVLAIPFNCFSQSNNGVNICDIKESTATVISVSLHELIECGELTPNNEHLSIVSFLFVTTTPRGDVLTIKHSGNKFSEKVFTAIEKYKPSKFYIEKIKLSSKKGTIQYAGAITVKFKN